MSPSNNLKTSGRQPSGRFITTYSSSYRPFSERLLQVNQPQTEAKAAPASFNLLQTKRESSPISYQFFYKTTNSTYGSSARLQPPSSHLLHASPSPYDILTPSISEGMTQEVRVAWDTGYLLGQEEKGQLHCVCGGKDMIAFSSIVDLACCEDFLRSLCREARLQHLLDLPVASSTIITNKDAENWDSSSYLRGLTPVIGQKNSSFLQPTSWQRSCCAWQTERPNSCCFEMQTFPLHTPQGSNLPLAHAPLTVHCTEPSRKPLLTEYQSSYGAEWSQPKIRMSDFHHHRPPCH